MDREKWKDVKAAFAEASALDVEKRHVYLSELDERLRPEVERLLSADDAAGDFIKQPFLQHASQTIGSPSETIGPYSLIKEIGTGGMGTVYLAERSGEGFSNRVALKLIKQGMNPDVVLHRFLTERQYSRASNTRILHECSMAARPMTAIRIS